MALEKRENKEPGIRGKELEKEDNNDKVIVTRAYNNYSLLAR